MAVGSLCWEPFSSPFGPILAGGSHAEFPVCLELIAHQKIIPDDASFWARKMEFLVQRLPRTACGEAGRSLVFDGWEDR